MENEDKPDETRERRHYWRFLPNVTTGELLQIAALIGGFVIAYGTYQSDKATTALEVAQIKRDAETNRVIVKESIAEVRADIKDLQRTLRDVGENVAVMKARTEQPKR